jgi:hypothetical protein
LRQLGHAAAPLEKSHARDLVNRTTAAGEYPQAAAAFEVFLPEMRTYLRHLEAIDPPASCLDTQRNLERMTRASIQIFKGALPLYRHNKGALLKSYMERAEIVLQPIKNPVEALDGRDRLPCEG